MPQPPGEMRSAWWQDAAGNPLAWPPIELPEWVHGTGGRALESEEFTSSDSVYRLEGIDLHPSEPTGALAVAYLDLRTELHAGLHEGDWSGDGSGHDLSEPELEDFGIVRLVLTSQSSPFGYCEPSNRNQSATDEDDEVVPVPYPEDYGAGRQVKDALAALARYIPEARTEDSSPSAGPAPDLQTARQGEPAARHAHGAANSPQNGPDTAKGAGAAPEHPSLDYPYPVTPGTSAPRAARPRATGQSSLPPARRTL